MSLAKSVKSFVKRLLLILLFVFFLLVIYLDSMVKDEFSQQAWDIPAKVYARSLSFSLGKTLSIKDLSQELNLLGYRKSIKATQSGEYEFYRDTFIIKTRPFQFWDGEQQSQTIQLSIKNSVIKSLLDFTSQQSLNYLRLDPLLLGSIQIGKKPTSQDRLIVNLNDLPNEFVSALLVSEDRQFFQHWGVSLRGITRALWSNIIRGEITQGGSTLTQQLMKNHFLSSERSLWRKGREAILALLTEYHYDKNTILQAYINEVYLGQLGNTAIHGFARASEIYFDKKLSKLNLPQLALLIGMVKGPSYYNPRRHPERALKRRNLVLQQMFEQNLISQQVFTLARSKNLMVVKVAPIKTSRVPALMGLIKRELRNDFSATALKRDGLRLFTSLDPVLQNKTENSLKSQLKKFKSSASLQGAVIVTDIASGEILAIVGDKNVNYVGFNRAIDAYRQTGSVIKPFVYLTALQQPQKYSLASLISDKHFSLTGNDGSVWSPLNYDKKEHGNSQKMLPLSDGLIHSYNIATARLAMGVGIDEVIETIHQLGFKRELPAFPSIALGSKEMSPLEILTLYQVLANQGRSVTPQAIVAVQDQQGNLINRYVKETEQVIDSEAAFLVRYLLTEVTKQGTAKSLSWRLPQIQLAGKTGTTNDLRDSWFAGFDNKRLAVVWLGRDDNQPTGLTGSSGALLVWADLFKRLNSESVDLNLPSGVVYGVKKGNFFSQLSSCKNKPLLPFYQFAISTGYELCD